MKKNITVFFLFISWSVMSQSGGLRIDLNSTFQAGGHENVQLFLNETENDYARIRLTNSLFNASSNYRFWDIAAKIGSTSSEDIMNFYSRGSGTDVLSLQGNGRVGILTTSPDAQLDVNGFTKLGPEAPKIKMKKMTGEITETGSSQFIYTDIPFVNKILAVDIFVFNESSGYSYPPGKFYNYTLWVDILAEQEFGGQEHRIAVEDIDTGIRGLPYTVLITYEE